MIYFQIFIYELKRVTAYKFHLFYFILSPLVPFFIQYYLWQSIYSSPNLNLKLSFDSIAWYYLITTLVFVMVKSNASTIAEEFKNGTIDNELTRPCRLMRYRFIRNLSERSVYTLITLPALIVIALIFKIKCPITLNYVVLFAFVIQVELAVVLSFYIDFLIGLMSLVIEEVWAVRSIATFILNFVAGYYLPLSLFPESVGKIFEYLPFSYILYHPTMILTSDFEVSQLLVKIIVSLTWVVILYFLSKYAINHLIKQYASYGG